MEIIQRITNMCYFCSLEMVRCMNGYSNYQRRFMFTLTITVTSMKNVQSILPNSFFLLAKNRAYCLAEIKKNLSLKIKRISTEIPENSSAFVIGNASHMSKIGTLLCISIFQPLFLNGMPCFLNILRHIVKTKVPMSN